jgi:hypothetical protein
MAGKQDLSILLSAEGAQPALRRGRGMRLSTDRAGDPESATDAQTHEGDDALSHQRTSAKAEPVRVNRGYKLREDLIRACKRIALEEDRRLYEVMEQALEAYVAQHAAGDDRASRG